MELRNVSKRYGLRRPWVVRQAILALASTGSPALAAIHRAGPARGSRLPLLALLAAVVVASAAWYASVMAAAHRS